MDEDAFVAPGPTLLCAVSEGDYLGKAALVKRIVLTLIHHQDIICCVACVRSSLRRIAPDASVVAPWRLAPDALLVIRNIPRPVDSYKEP